MAKYESVAELILEEIVGVLQSLHPEDEEELLERISSILREEFPSQLSKS